LLADKTAKSLFLAIGRLNSCFLREEQDDAILDATIAMEVLLLVIAHK